MADYKRIIRSNKYLSYFRQGVGKEMVGYIHTLSSCLSKPRSSLEGGKKQPIEWLQYVCGMTKMLLNPSFRVGFNPTFLTLGRANTIVLHLLNRKVPLVLLWFSYGDSEMARNRFEEGSKMARTGASRPKYMEWIKRQASWPHEPMFKS